MSNEKRGLSDCWACCAHMDFVPIDNQDGTQREICESCGEVNIVRWDIDHPGRWYTEPDQAPTRRPGSA